MMNNNEKKSNALKRKIWAVKLVPALIIFALWLDGWLFPIILLPIIYVLFIEKKSLDWLGFSRDKLYFSLCISIIIALILSGLYYPISLYYFNAMKMGVVTIYGIFFDVVWYPVYEEITYRSFLLTHFAEIDQSCLSSRNLIVNLFQSLLFLSIHKHHFAVPLVLLLVFALGLMNGFLFLRIRNIYGCIVSHSVLNGFALLIRHLIQVST